MNIKDLIASISDRTMNIGLLIVFLVTNFILMDLAPSILWAIGLLIVNIMAAGGSASWLSNRQSARENRVRATVDKVLAKVGATRRHFAGEYMPRALMDRLEQARGEVDRFLYWAASLDKEADVLAIEHAAQSVIDEIEALSQRKLIAEDLDSYAAALKAQLAQTNQTHNSEIAQIATALSEIADARTQLS
jgi:hypothetical protein